MVLSLQYGEFDALFTGDVEGEGEKELEEEISGRYDVLKVAHHGSKHSTKREILINQGKNRADFKRAENPLRTPAQRIAGQVRKSKYIRIRYKRKWGLP